MEFIPIKTKKFYPPCEDILSELDRVLLKCLKESDIVMISSKVVSIHEGRAVPISSISKRDIIAQEAEKRLPPENTGVPGLTLKLNTLVGSGGVDESNGDGFYILWPQDPNRSAQVLLNYLKQKAGLKNLAVLIVDSHCVPMRWGVIGVCIGFFGLKPVIDHAGKKDLFKRNFKHTRTNIVDGLAAGAVLAMGETNQQTPLCIARDVPDITFVNYPTYNELIIDIKYDSYQPLLKNFDQSRERHFEP